MNNFQVEQFLDEVRKLKHKVIPVTPDVKECQAIQRFTHADRTYQGERDGRDDHLELAAAEALPLWWRGCIEIIAGGSCDRFLVNALPGFRAWTTIEVKEKPQDDPWVLIQLNKPYACINALSATERLRPGDSFYLPWSQLRHSQWEFETDANPDFALGYTVLTDQTGASVRETATA